MSLIKKLFRGGLEKSEKVKHTVDYQGAADIIELNRNLLRALEHERSGVSFYARFYEQATDERCKELYRELIEEEERHLKMVLEQIERRKKEGTWTED
ncbi:MAG: hypothetical protein GTO08_07885 [Deltaproteobacteria bacterium]|nr:hypothetical protein [Deltaproteobacteria bacterium]